MTDPWLDGPAFLGAWTPWPAPDASGAELWRGETSDTVLAVPPGVHLTPGKQYVMRVDGQRTDGSSVSSTEVSVRASQ